MILPLLDTSAPRLSDATGPRSIGAVRVLRISITDRCNFRCVYCMPEAGVRWLPKDDLLSFEEIAEVARAAAEVHGVRRFKLTGGEPTVRHGLPDLVALLRRAVPTIEDLSLTTNGFNLESLATPLRESGLDRVTVSLDSLDAGRFRRVTRTGDLKTVLRGLDRAIDAGFRSVKVNCVAMRGTNDDEFADFARLALQRPITVRFIEYMPLGDSALLAEGNPFVATTDARGETIYHTDRLDDARSRPFDAPRGEVTRGGLADDEPRAHSGTPTSAPRSKIRIALPTSSHLQVAEDETGPQGGCGSQDRGDAFVAEPTIRAAIERELGPLVPVDRDDEPGVGPAVPYRFADHPDAPGRVAFISAMSAPFCSTCNRLRLTATGVLRSCLFEGGEVDLKPILRPERVVGSLAGRDVDERRSQIARAMERCVAQKPDVHGVRGNEQMSRIGG